MNSLFLKLFCRLKESRENRAKYNFFVFYVFSVPPWLKFKQFLIFYLSTPKKRIMKKIFILSICAWALCSCSPKRPAVVDCPAFDTWNSQTVEVAKVEMSDTATVLRMQAFFRPGAWIMISPETYIKDSEGTERLMVTGAEGIALGQKLVMPDSGKASFALYFPPLKPEVARIDFIESDCDGCFKIFGIRLLPGDKVKIDPLPKHAVEKKHSALPAPVFSAEKAQISGRYSGYSKELGFSEVVVYAVNPLLASGEELSLPIAPDGSFGGALAVGFPQAVNTSIGTLFVAPGKETKVYIDLKKMARNGARLRKDKQPQDSVYVYASGAGLSSRDVEAIAQISRCPRYDEAMKQTVGMKPEDFKAYIMAWLWDKMQYIEQSRQPRKLQSVAIANVKLWAADVLLSYKAFMESAYRFVQPTEDKDKLPEIVVPDSSYYTFLKDFCDSDLAYSSDYAVVMVDGVLQRLADLVGLPDKSASPAVRYAAFKEKIAPLFEADNLPLFDLVRARLYAGQLEQHKFFTDEEKVEIRAAFTGEPAYADMLMAENDKLKALVESNKNAARELPAVPQEKMLDAIVAKYKGKVVVVDFWATWCGPCKVALKEMKPLKEEMQGREVAFVYLTGETSPLATWSRMIKDIDGEHYRVGEAQWAYWYKALKIEGVPTFVVYDKQGRQQLRSTGSPGAAKLRAELERLLK